MKTLRLLILPLILLMASSAWAQSGPLLRDSDIAALHTATASAVRGTILPVTGYNTVGVEIITITDATITFEGSVSSTWSSISCTNKATGASATTATAAGAYVCDVAGLQSFSARISTFGSGTVTARGRAQVAAIAGGGGGSGSSDATAAKQDAQTALLTTIDADTGIISEGVGTSTDAAAGVGGVGTINAKLRVITTQLNTLGTFIGTEDAAETVGGGLARLGSVRRDVPASSAGTTGDNATVNTNALGATWVAHIDPCSYLARIYLPISQATSTELFTGTASNRAYVCGLLLSQPATSTQTFSLVSGTGSVCATSTGAMIGSTSAANGMQLPFAIGGSGASVAKSDTDAENVCLLQSTTDRLAGVLSYVVAPN